MSKKLSNYDLDNIEQKAEQRLMAQGYNADFDLLLCKHIRLLEAEIAELKRNSTVAVGGAINSHLEVKNGASKRGAGK